MLTLRDLLPPWFKGPEARLLADASQAFFEEWEAWLSEVPGLVDLATAPEAALELHGFALALKRLPDEPLALWRARVRNAIQAHRLGGVREGLDAALAAYGITGATVIERDPLFGEDTIRVEFQEAPYDSLVLQQALRERGRACRQYIVGSLHHLPLYLAALGLNHVHGVSVATDPQGPLESPDSAAPAYLAAISAGHVHSTSIAS